MSYSCPQCDNDLVASSVGLLCHGCGSLHRFYKTGSTNQVPNSGENKSSISSPGGNTANAGQDSLPPNSAEIHPFSKRMKSRLARLIVPELPDPQDAAHLLENHHQSQTLNSIDTDTAPPQTSQVQAIPTNTLGNDEHISQSNTASQLHHNSTGRLNYRRPLIIFAVCAAVAVMAAGAYFILTRPSKPDTISTEQTTKPVVDEASEKSKRDIKRKADIKEIATALEIYKKDTGAYPVGTSITATYVMSKSTPKYISYVNEDPQSTKTKPVLYSYRSEGTSFILSAKLENSNDAEAIDGYYIIQSN